MAATTITIDGIVTRIDGRLTEKRPYGAGRVTVECIGDGDQCTGNG